MSWFQKVQAGTASYAAGGFSIAVPEIEKIESASVFMTPETLLSTTKVAGIQLTYAANTAMVRVFARSESALWTEVADATNLGGANFILTGVGY